MLSVLSVSVGLNVILAALAGWLFDERHRMQKAAGILGMGLALAVRDLNALHEAGAEPQEPITTTESEALH